MTPQFPVPAPELVYTSKQVDHTAFDISLDSSFDLRKFYIPDRSNLPPDDYFF